MGMTEIAKATVTIIPTMKGAQQTITKEMSSAATPAGKTAGKKGGAKMLSGITSSLTALGPALLATVPAAIVTAVAKGLYDIGEEFDEMSDTIVIGTGATGEALEELEDIAKNIATEVPTSFEDAGDTVQDLNTRLGLTGDTLEDVGRKIEEVGHLTETDFDTEAFAGAMAAWGEASDDMSSDLDTLFAVSQSTGIGMNDLVSITESVAPTMKNLGYSFDDTAAMAGMLDKAGLDANSTLSKMAKGMVTLAQDGEEPAEAMNRVTQEIQGYIDKGDQASALDLAAEIFGTRGAAQFVAAVESGALSIDDFIASVEDSDGIIDETTDRTSDFAEEFTILKNKIKEFLEPIATPLFDALSDGMSAIGTAFDNFRENGIPALKETFAPAIEGIQGQWENFKAAFTESNLGEEFGKLKEELQPFVDKVLKPLGKLLLKFVQKVFPVIGKVLGTTLVVTIKGVIAVIRGIVAFIKGVIKVVKKIIDIIKKVVDAIKNVIEWIKDIPNKAGDAVSKVKDAFKKVKDFIKAPFEAAIDFIKSIPGKIVGFFKGLGKTISDAIGSIIPDVTWESLTVAGVETPIKIPHITWGATGGILDGAQLIGAGEAGREALLPLDRNTGWMDELGEHISGGNNFTVNMTVDGAKDPALYASEFTRQLKMLVRTGAV